jgi:hypothetical protein
MFTRAQDFPEGISSRLSLRLQDFLQLRLVGRTEPLMLAASSLSAKLQSARFPPV